MKYVFVPRMLSIFFCAQFARVGLAQAPAAGYGLSESYVGGQNFLSKWTFFSQPDPSHGAVTYLNYGDASAAGLAKETADQVHLAADAETVGIAGAGRRSVRIQSTNVYNKGLFVVKLAHIPTGCGTWPAFWMYGEDSEHGWPLWGEYDIVEGVHSMNTALTTLHTGIGCDQSSLVEGIDFSSRWMIGTKGNRADRCYVKAYNQYENQGCSQRGPDGSMGATFNARGGGTFAAEWDPNARHIRTWFWPLGSEPLDLENQTPQPDSWGTPYSFFSLAPDICPSSHFVNMRLVFSLNFCGDLGAPLFKEMCPEFAASGLTCEDYVAKHPEAMSEAYWTIEKLDVYQRSAFGDPAPSIAPLTFLSDTRGAEIDHSQQIPLWPKAISGLVAIISIVGVVLVARVEWHRMHSEGSPPDTVDSGLLGGLYSSQIMQSWATSRSQVPSGSSWRDLRWTPIRTTSTEAEFAPWQNRGCVCGPPMDSETSRSQQNNFWESYVSSAEREACE